MLVKLGFYTGSELMECTLLKVRAGSSIPNFPIVLGSTLKDHPGTKWKGASPFGR